MSFRGFPQGDILVCILLKRSVLLAGRSMHASGCTATQNRSLPGSSNTKCLPRVTFVPVCRLSGDFHLSSYYHEIPRTRNCFRDDSGCWWGRRIGVHHHNHHASATDNSSVSNNICYLQFNFSTPLSISGLSSNGCPCFRPPFTISSNETGGLQGPGCCRS